MTEQTIPPTYLSVRTNGNGRRRWACIHRGSPLCPDCDSPEIPVANYRSVTNERRFDVPVPLWDGDAGRFTTWQL